MVDSSIRARSSPEDARALTEELGRALYSLMPAEADRIEYEVRKVAPLGLETARWIESNNDRHPARVPDEVTALAKQLREAMYRPGAGTWFKAAMTVTRAGSMDVDFNYDDEPDWDAPIDPHMYVQDLQKFPREDAAIPKWLHDRLAEAGQ
jgi:hypothetical protein